MRVRIMYLTIYAHSDTYFYVICSVVITFFLIFLVSQKNVLNLPMLIYYFDVLLFNFSN